MAQDVCQDWVISLPAMHGLMNILEGESNQAENVMTRVWVASLGAFAVIGFCGSFRGSEVLLSDLYGLRKFLEDTEKSGRDHVVMPLLGWFKGEQNTCYHLSFMASVTSLGIHIKRWVERLVRVQEQEGYTHGPAFCDRAGEIARAFEYEVGFIERLLEVQASDPEAISPEVDIHGQFGVSQSFRRGVTSVVRKRCIQLINRWRTVEKARGRKPSLPMHEHYLDVSILVPEMIKFSLGL
jgi:hypothetical protein